MRQILGNPRTMKPLAAGALAVLLMAAACASYDPAVFDERLRAATFDKYWQALEDDYPYFEFKGIDWRAARERYRPAALAAPTHIAFYHVLARMLNELDDWHVRLDLGAFSDAGVHLSMLPHGLVSVDRRLHIEWLDLDAETVASLAASYPMLAAIDGVPVRDPRLAEILLVGEAGSTVELDTKWPDGSRRRYELERPSHLSFTYQLTDQSIFSQRADQVGYLVIRSFSTDDRDGDADSLIAEIDREIDKLQDTRAIIIDVQDNTGGNSDVLQAALGRFLPARVLFGRGLWLYFGPFSFVGSAYVEPRPPCYRGEVVILTSPETGSAAEWFAWIMQREGRAKVVGERTAGAEAGTQEVGGPDGSTLTFGWRWMTDGDGHGLQDTGVAPDVPVPLSIDLVRRHGYEKACDVVLDERLRRALELIDATSQFEALIETARMHPKRRWESGRSEPRAIKE